MIFYQLLSDALPHTCDIVCSLPAIYSSRLFLNFASMCIALHPTVLVIERAERVWVCVPNCAHYLRKNFSDFLRKNPFKLAFLSMQ